MKRLLIFILLSITASASAQDRATGGGAVEVLETSFSERLTRGKLNACEITYMIAYEDHIYNQGAVTVLRGALSFAGFIDAKDKPPAILLKVTAFDFNGNNLSLAPLDYAYLSTSEKIMQARNM